MVVAHAARRDPASGGAGDPAGSGFWPLQGNGQRADTDQHQRNRRPDDAAATVDFVGVCAGHGWLAGPSESALNQQDASSGHDHRTAEHHQSTGRLGPPGRPGTSVDTALGAGSRAVAGDHPARCRVGGLGRERVVQIAHPVTVVRTVSVEVHLELVDVQIAQVLERACRADQRR